MSRIKYWIFDYFLGYDIIESKKIYNHIDYNKEINSNNNYNLRIRLVYEENRESYKYNDKQPTIGGISFSAVKFDNPNALINAINNSDSNTFPK